MSESRLALIEAAIGQVNSGDHDSFGTLTRTGDSSRWVQYTPGTINATYPFEDSPQDRLSAFKFDELMEWTPGVSVTLEYFFEPAEVAIWIDRYFREILGCEADYELIWKPEL
jgi:hypothetical protein